jgi:Zn-dependent M28 family amino/carboxypeptidase
MKTICLSGLAALLAAMAVAHCGGGSGTLDAGAIARDAGASIDADDQSAGNDVFGGVDAGPEAALGALVSKDNYAADLAAIAVARAPGSDDWQRVQDLCAQRFASLGYAVERHPYGTGTNIIGVRKGAGAPGGQVLVSAHYDSIPDCEGADDNASGVAGVLETARVLSTSAFERDLVVACWDEEEGGLLGSKAYSARAKERGNAIAVALVYEMIGFKNDAEDSQTLPNGLDLLFPDQAAWLKRHKNRADFIAFVSDESARDASAALQLYAGVFGLPTVLLELTQELKLSAVTGTLRRSDHSPFWRDGYPAIMISDTSEYRNPNYHCTAAADSVATLDPDFAVRVIRTTTAAAAAALGL